MNQRPVRTAAALSTLTVSFVYLLAQMAGAGGLVALLLGVTDVTGQGVVIAIVGVVMIAYVLIGGMKGTTWVQMIKATLLFAGGGIMAIWVMAKNGFNLSTLLANAVAVHPKGEKILEPVSYTHLDVYKRQAWPHARSRSPSPWSLWLPAMSAPGGRTPAATTSRTSTPGSWCRSTRRPPAWRWR